MTHKRYIACTINAQFIICLPKWINVPFCIFHIDTEDPSRCISPSSSDIERCNNFCDFLCAAVARMIDECFETCVVICAKKYSYFTASVLESQWIKITIWFTIFFYIIKVSCYHTININGLETENINFARYLKRKCYAYCLPTLLFNIGVGRHYAWHFR